MKLTLEVFKQELGTFKTYLEKQPCDVKNDGKAVGTYVEQKLRIYLSDRGFVFDNGNSAKGIDLPEIDVDIKTTSIKQPQSSSPFKDATQKIFGLGHHLVVFVYDKREEGDAPLKILHTIFVDKTNTADYTLTMQIQKCLDTEGSNQDDIQAILYDKNIPIDDISIEKIALKIFNNKKIDIGYLTISNALQWRLQYARVIEKAGTIDGIERL